MLFPASRPPSPSQSRRNWPGFHRSLNPLLCSQLERRTPFLADVANSQAITPSEKIGKRDEVDGATAQIWKAKGGKREAVDDVKAQIWKAKGGKRDEDATANALIWKAKGGKRNAVDDVKEQIWKAKGGKRDAVEQIWKPKGGKRSGEAAAPV